MKRFFHIFIIFIFIGYSNILSAYVISSAYVEEKCLYMNDVFLDKKDNIFYTSDNHKPFSGCIQTKHDKIITKNYIEEGKLLHFKELDEDGYLMTIGLYKDNKFDGEIISYYPNGQLKSKTTSKDGRKVYEIEQPQITEKKEKTIHPNPPPLPIIHFDPLSPTIQQKGEAQEKDLYYFNSGMKI